MDYKALIDLFKEENQAVQDVFLLSNHNGELLNHNHNNLLDVKTFSVEMVNRVNQQLMKIPGESLTYDWIIIDPQLFLDRMNSMIAYFEQEDRTRDAMQLKGITQTILHLDPNEITVTKKPNVFADEEEVLHPDLLKRPLIRRVLSGFVVFRELQLDEIVRRLEQVFMTRGDSKENL